MVALLTIDNLDGVARFADAIGAPAWVPKALDDAVTAFVPAFEAIARKQVGQLLGGTGELSKSMQVVFLPGPPMVLELTSTKPYARIQDLGGTIRSSRPNGKLAIPLSFAGVPRGKWPRDWARGDLVALDRPGQNPLLMRAMDWKPMYVLVDEVTLKGVGYSAKTGQVVTPLLVQEILKVLADAGSQLAKKAISSSV